MKLTSSKNFGKTLKDKTDSEYRRLRDNFDHFIDQSLRLGMFVPTDEAGNVLKEPSKKDMERFKGLAYGDFSCDYTRIFEYVEAKERVLFEGFELHNGKNVINRDLGIVIVFSGIISILIEGNNGLGGFSKNDATIEDLVILGINLTKTAIKQIGL